MAITGITKLVAEVMNASREVLASSTVNGRSTRVMPSRARRSSSVRRVTPGRMPLSSWRVTRRPSRSTIQALAEAPSVTKPLASTNHASSAPSALAAS